MIAPTRNDMGTHSAARNVIRGMVDPTVVLVDRARPRIQIFFQYPVEKSVASIRPLASRGRRGTMLSRYGLGLDRSGNRLDPERRETSGSRVIHRRGVDHAPSALGFGSWADVSPSRALRQSGATSQSEPGERPVLPLLRVVSPNQAYQASQPRPQDTINANAVSRQYSALRDRGELFEPTSPFGGAEEGLEPFGPSSPRRGGQTPRASGEHIGNPRGAGPPEYYNRTARYFPNMRVGRGANRNIAVMRRGGMGPGSPTGGSGMPSMGGMR